MAYHLPHWVSGRTGLWYPDFPHIKGFPPFDEYSDLIELLDWVRSGQLLEAHNAWFERGIWQNILVPTYSFPAVHPDQWRCSQAKAAAYALPRKLGEVAKVLKLGQQKTKGGMDVDDGTKTKNKTYKPRKPRKAEREKWEEEHGDAKHPTLYWETPDVLFNLFAYCRQDVLAEEELSSSLEDLSEDETALYLLDQTINERGFQLDMHAVSAAQKLIAKETTRLNKQLQVLTKGVVKKATQRDQMKAWFETQGLTLPNTQKATIDGLLETNPPHVSATAYQGLQLVRTLGRSSTAKYRKMSDWACPDGRVRGGLLYHGASTGRWSGAGPQPHNFPKGQPDGPGKDQEGLWGNLLAGKTALYPDVLEALSEALRGAITASPGKQLYVADFSSIEACVLLWLADDQDALSILRSGADLYLEMASEIYGRNITKADKAERQLGKVAVLGCFAADTLVLTPRGWVPIISITKSDPVWDGEAWVLHDGVVDQGSKETVCLHNINLTSDHLILTGNRWLPADVALNEHNLSLALETGLENLPSEGISGGCGALRLDLWPNAPAVMPPTELQRAIYGKAQRPVVTPVLSGSLHINEKPITGTQTLFPTEHKENDYLTESAPSMPDAKVLHLKVTQTMVDAVFAYFLPGGMTGGRFSLILQLLKGGISQVWNWIEQIMKKGMSRIISGLLPGQLTWATDDKFKKCNDVSLTLKPVYDIANAGPRQRFTILSNKGPLIVHNCGYQMGWSKFIDTAQKMGGLTIDENMSRLTVETYRNKFWRVKNLWTDMETAAIKAVQNPGQPHSANGIAWEYERPFLFCYLPSGRRLAYPFPQVKKKATPWGEMRLQLSFEGMNPITHQWGRQTTYGGSLVENVVQAIARDLLASALVRCECSNVYVPVLSVHDEVVTEARQGTGSVEEFTALMVELPEWAVGCPVKAESWTGFRYRK